MKCVVKFLTYEGVPAESVRVLPGTSGLTWKSGIRDASLQAQKHLFDLRQRSGVKEVLRHS